MEILMVLVVVMVLCLILNISLNYILLSILTVICIGALFFAISFLYCLVVMLSSKRKEAEFVRIGPAKGERFQVAFYRVEGAEYPCMFPGEAILTDKLYRTDKPCRVMWHPRKGKVFDRYACITCVLGLVVSVALSVGIGIVLMG